MRADGERLRGLLARAKEKRESEGHGDRCDGENGYEPAGGESQGVASWMSRSGSA
jgi:hypothetical protein